MAMAPSSGQTTAHARPGLEQVLDDGRVRRQEAGRHHEHSGDSGLLQQHVAAVPHHLDVVRGRLVGAVELAGQQGRGLLGTAGEGGGLQAFPSNSAPPIAAAAENSRRI
jgi:hypothetical protein